jgi:hypothetical protein
MSYSGVEVISGQHRKSQGRKKWASKINSGQYQFAFQVSPEVKGRIDRCILDSDNIIRNKIES